MISANDFAILNKEFGVSLPPVTSWHHTSDGGATWDRPVEFNDSFAEYSLDRPSIVTAPGGLFGISTDRAALQFSLDGGRTWQSRSF